MNNNEYNEALLELFELNGLERPNESLSDKLRNLSFCLLETNKIHNLTAIKEEEDVIVKHFIDSILISRVLPEGASVVDVGCGPGFPTLPIAVYRPDLSILGIDSTAKKINFVNSTATQLGLDNVTAISARAEAVAHTAEYREKFDVATARAVASLPVLAELCLPFVKVGGIFVAMKAQSAADELNSAKNAIEKCGGEFVQTVRLDLRHRRSDKNDEERNLIIIKKVRKTQEIYPRDYAKISKKPL